MVASYNGPSTPDSGGCIGNEPFYQNSLAAKLPLNVELHTAEVLLCNIKKINISVDKL